MSGFGRETKLIRGKGAPQGACRVERRIQNTEDDSGHWRDTFHGAMVDYQT